MDYMIDSLNLEAIKKWNRILPLAGVTSNPSIAKIEGGVPFFERIREVGEIIGESASVHVQVIAQDCDGILRDAARIRQECGKETFIKIPVTEEGLAAIKILKKEGYFITATAIYTSFQGLLAIEAGADYLAPYFNRMENLNIKPEEVLAQLWQVIDREQRPCKILAASFKNLSQITKAIESGAQAVTVSPELFEAGFAMPSIQKAVEDFAQDWESTYHSGTI